MAIENTYLLGKNITLGCGFDLQAKAPLDSRQTVPAFAGLQALIDGNAAYEGMIVYDEETKKTYQAQMVDGALAFREFGINEAELKNLIASETTAAMEFKGAATALPENPTKGDMYKVTAAFKVGEEDVKVGDSIVYSGEQWFIIPSGDDIEDTWRPVTDVDNDATLTFAAGNKLDVAVASNGTITYSHEAIDAPTNMNEEGDEQTRTYITQLITDNHGHIIGFKTATETVEDTNTTYEFEGLPVVEGENAPSSVYFQVKSSEEEAAEVIYLDAYSKNEVNTELAKKVDKETYEADKATFAIAETVNEAIEANAQAIEDLETYVGTIPTDEAYKDITNVIAYVNKKAEEAVAAAQGGSSETAASVKTQLDSYKTENNTRVQNVEDAVAALESASATHATKDELNAVDAKFASYNTTEAQKAIDDAQDIRIKTIEDTIVNFVDQDAFTEAYDELLNTISNEETARSEADEAINSKVSELESLYEGFAEHVNDTIKAEEDARKAAVESVQGEVNALKGRVDTAEGKITALETESAKHALKTEVEAVDAKFADYKTAVAQKAIDDEQDRRLGVLEGASATHALKTEVEAVDAKFADYTKTADLPTDLGDFTNNAGYAKTADVNVELDKKVDKATYTEDKATFALKTDLNAYRTSADQDEIDADFEERIADLEAIDHDQLAKDASAAAVATVLDGAPEKFDTLKEIAAWIAEADTAEDAASLVTRVSALEAIDHEAYVAADNALHTTISKEIDDDVKAAIDAEVLRADGAYDAKGAAADAQATAEATAAGALATARTEITTEIGTAKSGAEAKAAELDAALKTELQGEITAGDAATLEAAKTDASNKDAVVLAEAQKGISNLASVVYTKEEVEALISAAHTWGEF